MAHPTEADTLFFVDAQVAANNCFFITGKRPSPLLQALRQRQNKNRKLTAAVLAFPFPFGIVGLHRIYLGCAPYVPVVYIATSGGGFGVLPFIDFFVLVFSKDVDRFANNRKVFMWAN